MEEPQYSNLEAKQEPMIILIKKKAIKGQEYYELDKTNIAQS